mmetsp:Transcript_58352/g.126173  ORF Transcript_58352/g.126173 Transcript_58352/m.126173 type:complete len:359 (+) Transcript_58352:119-1195(+)
MLFASLVAILTLGWICIILRTRGAATQACACALIISLTSTQLLMKVLMTAPFNFRFPAVVSTLHLASATLGTLLFWAIYGDLRKFLPQSLGSSTRYLKYVAPIACSMPLSIIFNNQAIAHVGAGMNAVIGTLTPVTTALLSNLLGRQLHIQAWAGVFVASVGAIIITIGETAGLVGSHSIIAAGLAFAIFAVLFRSAKVVLQDMLLAPADYTGESEPLKPLEALHPMHVWALQAPPSLAFAALYTLATEDVADAWLSLTPAIALLILCTCIASTALNVLGMYIIRDLGAGSMQIIGKLNTIITVAVSVSMLKEMIPTSVLGGTSVVLLGVAIFENSPKMCQKLNLQATEKQNEPACIA